MTARERCVLAYSGGLDTSVAIRWLQEELGYDVVTLTADLGEFEGRRCRRREGVEHRCRERARCGRAARVHRLVLLPHPGRVRAL